MSGSPGEIVLYSKGHRDITSKDHIVGGAEPGGAGSVIDEGFRFDRSDFGGWKSDQTLQWGRTDETKAAFANSTAMVLWYLANIFRDLNLDFEATVETGITNISSMFEKRG